MSYHTIARHIHSGLQYRSEVYSLVELKLLYIRPRSTIYRKLGILWPTGVTLTHFPKNVLKAFFSKSTIIFSINNYAILKTYIFFNFLINLDKFLMNILPMMQYFLHMTKLLKIDFPPKDVQRGNSGA